MDTKGNKTMLLSKFLTLSIFYFYFFLQSILHNWDDDNCIKILKKCKYALFSNGKNGKIIIIKMVVNEKQDEHEVTQVKLKLDITMASVNGKERNAEEWKKLLMASGFRDCKISPFT